jgi:2-keto-4-pentenoate hydratase/2-oxohepta-3-ene-1,7-dioic acid hydratase in catechol pathway
MRIAVFVSTGKRLGAIVDDKIIDLNLAYEAYLTNVSNEPRPYAHAEANVPSSLLAFLEGGQKSVAEAKRAMEYAEKNFQAVSGPQGEKVIYTTKDVRILAPLPSFGSKITAMGGNFGRHRAETETGKETQVLRGFMSPSSSVIGPDEPVIYPPRTKKLDYEVECAAIIGRIGKDIPRSRAREHIFGFTVMNDLSARDTRGHPSDREIYQFVNLQKNWDCSKPPGPWILVPEPGDDVYKLRMEMKINGTVRQSDTVDNMIYEFEDIIEFFSEDWTWHPGDIIGSGTPSEVALGQERMKNDLSWYLKPGDVMEASIEKIGTLRNKIVEKRG